VTIEKERRSELSTLRIFAFSRSADSVSDGFSKPVGRKKSATEKMEIKITKIKSFF
jgi:hypothetical protein